MKRKFQPKISNRMIAVILCMAWALSLGFFVPSAVAASGGFVEKSLVMPQGYSSLTNPAALPTGGFALAAKRADTGAWELLTFASPDGEPTVSPLSTAQGDILGISIAPDGQLMTTQADMSALQENFDAAMTTAVWHDPSGKAVSSFTLPGLLSSAIALNGRKVACLEPTSGITTLDEQGKTVASIARHDVDGMVAASEGLCVLFKDKAILAEPSGKILRTYPAPSNADGVLVGSPDGQFYLASLSGLYRLAADTEATLLSSIMHFQIGAPDSNLSGLCALTDGTLVAYLSDGSGIQRSEGGGGGALRMRFSWGGSGTLLAYQYDANLDTSANAAFSITALRDSTTLRKAVSAFQLVHPEITVSLSALLAEDDESTPTEDAVRTLNTDLLAGRGGDILILDEMPLDHYIQKGVLAPLDDVLADIGFMPGILEASRAADGKLYAMPAQFTCPMLWGSKAKLEGVNILDSLVNLPLDQAQELMQGRTPEQLIALFYPASQRDFLDENGQPRFDTPTFEHFLEQMYQMYATQGNIPPVPHTLQERIAVGTEELQGMINGSLALLPDFSSSFFTISTPYTAAGKEDSICIPVPGLSGIGRAYIPNLLASINARTAHRGLCEEFLRMLYSPEIQEMETTEGLPTVAASMEVMVSQAKVRSFEMSQNKKDVQFRYAGGNPIIMTQPGDDTWDVLHQIYGTLNQAYLVDHTLLGFITEETTAFFDGQATAQDAAAALQQRASAYLNE